MVKHSSWSIRAWRAASASALLSLVAALALDTACSQRSAEDGPAGAAVTRTALAASTSISAAFSGKIVEPATSLIAAATPGNFDVGADGSTSYEVPIWVPEGVNGLKPSLALEYGSSAPTGMVGPKWRLTGLSVIQRCAQTLAQDAVQRSVNLTGDVFCLDGHRLYRQTGTPNQTGDFQAETNPFQKISATAADAAGVTTFQVDQPDGRIFYYGRTAASRLSLSTTAEVNYAFYLDKIQDRFGNSILISYTSQRSQFTPALASYQVQELFPSSIQWGSTGDTPGKRQVTFQYAPATSYKPLRRQRWIHGYQLLAGEQLKSISVYGPDAFGNASLLRQYNLTYTAPSITGRQLLTSLQECDGANVCKRATSFGWEKGSLGYTRTDLTTTAGITDLPMTTAPTLTDLAGDTASLTSIYRRIIPVDLNRDGRDDLVYRVYGSTCISWVARLATSAGGYGAPFALPGATDADPGCPGGSSAGTTQYWANTGDLAFADLDHNGYPDVISSVGNSNPRLTKQGFPLFPGAAVLSGYRFYYNNSSSPLGYTGGFGFDGNGVTTPSDPTLGLGDVDGDGYPDIIRPSSTYATDGKLVWQASRSAGMTPSLGTIAGIGQGVRDFDVVDADGDGVAEIFRLGANDGWEHVTSPTTNLTMSPLNGALPMASRAITMPVQFSYGRWMVDLNGDGVLDFVSPSVFVQRYQFQVGFGDSGGPGAPMYLNGFTDTVPTTDELGVGYQNGLDDGVRIADFNLDGLDDLILMGNGADASGPSRDKVKVLLSNGDGTFTPASTSIPIGDPSDGDRSAMLYLQKYIVPAEHGYRTSVELDINGDGLPDFVQLEGGHVVSYVRQGKMPDVVTTITEGTGRQFQVAYAPLSDAETYTVDAACGTGSANVGCLVRGRWLTQQVTENVLETQGVGQSQVFRYAYTNGQFDTTGSRGFLGFQRRDVYGPGSNHTSVTYNLGLRSLGAGYIYATAFMPSRVQTDVDTPQGPYSHHTELQTIAYGNIWSSGVGNTSLTVLPSTIVDKWSDCAGNRAGGCSGTARLLASRTTSLQFDVYGNNTSRTVAYGNSVGTTEYETDTVTYNPADTTNWLVRQLAQRVQVSSNYSETVTRTTKFVVSPTTQSLDRVEIEPTGDNTTHLLRVYTRDSQGRVQQVSESSFPSSVDCNNRCSTACNTNCANRCATSASPPSCTSSCLSPCIMSCTAGCMTTPSQTRTTGYQYALADGVYASAITDPLGHTTHEWRHPSYGVLVEYDDPNQLAATATYDTFGRLVSSTDLSGATRSVTYADSEDPIVFGGVDYTMVPDNTATAAQQFHADSLGRPVMHTAPIDASRTITLWDQYDGRGRRTARVVYTGAPGLKLGTIQNTFAFAYDDLNRPLSLCHTAADGTPNVCKTNSFNELQVTTADESGHTVVRTVDNVGRLASVQTADPFVMTYGYGPFGQLETVSSGENSDQTTLGYDVRGRRTTVARTRAATRAVTYDAFGEIVSTTKLSTTQPQADTLTYGRDALGRLTSVAGAGMNRTLYWDKSAQGVFGTNSIGKLVDVFDGPNQVHYEYNANGLLLDEDWKLSLFGAAVKDFGEALYFYDTYGRVTDLIYPENLPGGNYTAFHPVFAYDPYVGSVSSVSMSGSTIWAATARNVLGEVTTESLHSWGGAAMTRTSTYDLPTGQLATQALTGAGGGQQVQESYSYLPDGLASTFGMTGVGGSFTESFGYDNLDRLTTWTPASGAPTVSYQYDGDGDMMRRQWSGETVQYAWSPSSRTASLTRNGLPMGIDTYAVDPWGRIFDTPVTTLTYDAMDEVVSAVEKVNGNQLDTFVHDGLGNRVATTYGTNPAGSYALSLMHGLYEFKYDSRSGTYEERNRFLANGRIIGDQVKTANNAFSQTTFYLTNNVGSVVAEASNTGVVTARARRDPYGNLLTNATTPYLGSEPTSTDPDGTSRFGFADHDREASLGLVDMNARFYSPRLGIFISPDSVIGNALDARDYSPFAYTWDNPVSHTDVTGHGLAYRGCNCSGAGGGGEGDGPGSWSMTPASPAPGSESEVTVTYEPNPDSSDPEAPTSGGTDPASTGSSELIAPSPASAGASVGTDATNAPATVLADNSQSNVPDENVDPEQQAADDQELADYEQRMRTDPAFARAHTTTVIAPTPTVGPPSDPNPAPATDQPLHEDIEFAAKAEEWAGLTTKKPGLKKAFGRTATFLDIAGAVMVLLDSKATDEQKQDARASLTSTAFQEALTSMVEEWGEEAELGVVGLLGVINIQSDTAPRKSAGAGHE